MIMIILEIFNVAVIQIYKITHCALVIVSGHTYTKRAPYTPLIQMPRELHSTLPDTVIRLRSRDMKYGRIPSKSIMFIAPFTNLKK